MDTGPLSKITTPKARDICALAAAAGKSLRPAGETSPAEYLKLLLANSALDDAVQFIAFGLPKREAVWWACLCARSELGEAPSAMAPVAAAEAWVFRPTDENRRAAMQAAETAEFQNAAAWAAVAAFWSAGSMAPAGQAPVPPPAHLTGVAVSGAVTLAAVQSEPALADEKRRRYIAMAIDIANGGNGRVDGPTRMGAKAN